MTAFKSILPESREQGTAPRRNDALQGRPASARPVSAMSGSERREGRSTRRNKTDGSMKQKENMRPSGPKKSHNHKKRSAFNRATLGTIAAFCVLVLILVPTILTLLNTNRQLDQAKKMQTSLASEREELQTSVNELKSQLDIVNTDSFIEKYAHEKLGMVRPNEILVRMRDGEIAVDKDRLASFDIQASDLDAVDGKDKVKNTSSAEAPKKTDASNEQKNAESAPQERANDNAMSEIPPQQTDTAPTNGNGNAAE